MFESFPQGGSNAWENGNKREIKLSVRDYYAQAVEGNNLCEAENASPRDLDKARRLFVDGIVGAAENVEDLNPRDAREILLLAQGKENFLRRGSNPQFQNALETLREKSGLFDEKYIPEQPQYDYHAPEPISEPESREYMEAVEIHGESYNGKILTPEILEAEGLAPRHKVELGDSVVWLSSSAYDLGDGRLAVVGYVEKNGKTIARSFYRSNSQGIWRYLPNYQEEDGRVVWYGKGYSEEGVMLPIELQAALAEITAEGEPVLTVSGDPEFILAGTVRSNKGGDRGTYFHEIESVPKRLEGNFYPPDRKSKIPPEQIGFENALQEPDLSRLLAVFTMPTSLYGEVNVEVFSSKDGSKYMFCRDKARRSWVGGIEDTSPMQSVGLRKSWISAGDLATPPMEYSSYTCGYGNEEIQSGSYVDMYANYLSKIPIIQKYEMVSAPWLALFDQIDELGGVQGSLEYYNAKELKAIINRVRTGQATLDNITNAAGIREKVQRLLG